MTDRETAVAREIVRMAREELKLAASPVPGEPLSSALDSLALLALVVAVEDRFRVVLTEQDGAGVRTLEDLARVVAARTGDQGLPAGGPAP